MKSGEHPGIPAREPLGISRGTPALSGPEDKAAATVLGRLIGFKFSLILAGLVGVMFTMGQD